MGKIHQEQGRMWNGIQGYSYVQQGFAGKTSLENNDTTKSLGKQSTEKEILSKRFNTRKQSAKECILDLAKSYEC